MRLKLQHQLSNQTSITSTQPIGVPMLLIIQSLHNQTAIASASPTVIDPISIPPWWASERFSIAKSTSITNQSDKA